MAFIGKACIVCGEPVPLNELEVAALNYGGAKIETKMCDKCRNAILFIRNMMDEGPVVLDKAEVGTVDIALLNKAEPGTVDIPLLNKKTMKEIKAGEMMEVQDELFRRQYMGKWIGIGDDWNDDKP